MSLRKKLKPRPLRKIKKPVKQPGQPGELYKSDITWMHVDRICFRGDDRPPKEIFANGFTTRKQGERVLLDPLNSDGNNVVPISTRFRSAVMFPFDPSVEQMWVYVLKPENVFDVKNYGYKYFAQDPDEKKFEELFGEELITDDIKPENIICAVKIKRFPLDVNKDEIPEYLEKAQKEIPFHERVGRDAVYRDAEEGFFRKVGKYKIVSYKLNPNCKLSKKDISLAEWFIKREIEANKKKIISASQLPMPTSGFYKDSFFKKPKKMELIEKSESTTKKVRSKK